MSVDAPSALKIDELRRREAELTEARRADHPDPTQLDALIEQVRSAQRAVDAARKAEAATRQAVERRARPASRSPTG